MGSTVICISASDGAEAEAVATAVGRSLGFRVVNEEIVARAAAEAGVDQHTIEDVEQRRTALTKVMELLALWGASTPEFFLSSDPQLLEAVPGVSPHAGASARSTEELRSVIRSAIEEFMAAGNVVILAHAASQSLAGRDGVLRVFVTASPAKRGSTLARSLGVSDREAGELIRKGDAGRADYLKRFYGIERELPTDYDVVLNMDNLAAEDAAAAIVSLAAGSLSGTPA